ncbi:MAG: hypothetical protein HOO96_37505 [Polyangiaceae bacterium]|nr:hypothetical protein [Polyangiaceae bacterium]
MSTHDDDSRIALLRQHLGERFERFIGALDAEATEPLFWQARALDEIEAQSGIRFSRSPAELASLLRPLLPVPARMHPADVPDWITVDSLEGSAPLQGEGTVTGGKRWYFCARGEHWELWAGRAAGADPLEDEGALVHEEPYGSHRFDASYMPQDEARAFIVGQLTRWKASLLDEE